MTAMTTEDLLRLLPPDERAMLVFLNRQGDEFISRETDLMAMLDDCSPARFRLLAKRLTERGLIERQKLHWVGTRWMIRAKLPADAPKEGALFTIPQNLPTRPNVVTYLKQAALLNALPLDALPLVGKAPARKPPVHFFPRGKSGFDFVWHIVDARGDAVRDCSSVKATLYRGRSSFGVGGVAVPGFRGVSMQSIGEGDYLARVSISASTECGSDYTVVVDMRRHGKHFGHFEVPSAVIDP